jgi:hypothetical protein
MATNQSIGNLAAILTANADQLVNELNRAATAIERTEKTTKTGFSNIEKQVETTGLKILTGARVFSEIHQEIMHVIEDIDHIPGVPAETVASVNDLKAGMHWLRNEIDLGVASAINFGVQFAKSVGVGAAMMVGYDDTSALSKLQSPDELAEQNDPNYHDKVIAAEEKLAEARQKAAIAAKSEGEQVKALADWSERYEKIAQSVNRTTLQKIQDQTKAYELDQQANAKLKDLTDKYNEAQKKQGESFDKMINRGESLRVVYDGLRDQQSRIMQQMGQLPPNFLTDPVALQKMIDLTKQLTDVQNRLAPVIAKLKGPVDDLRNSFVSAFQGGSDELAKFITEGKANFGDFFKTLEQDVLSTAIKLEVINPLLNGLFGLTGTKNELNGFSGSLFGALGHGIAGFFADGGRPMAGQPSIVGENGPELFIPDSAGTVVPGGRLGGSGVTVHQTIQVTAGVAPTVRAEMARMMPALKQQATAGIIEALSRGGSRGRALGGR